MNKILFLVSAIALVACGSGSIKTEMAVKAGETEMNAGECKHFSSGLFGFGSSWPLDITSTEGSELEGGADLEEGHYVVSADGQVTDAEEACEETKENDDSAATDGDSDDATDENTTDEDDTPTEATEATEGDADSETQDNCAPNGC